MNAPTIILIAATMIVTGGLIALARRTQEKRPKLTLFLKKTTVFTIVAALGGSVATATQFYTDRPALIAYMSAPVIVGIIWTLYRIEAASPGRITGLIRGNQRRRSGPSRRQPRFVPKFLPSLRGWLTLVIFEDVIKWRIIHTTCIGAAWLAAALLPEPASYIAPWVITLVTAARWMKVQSQRNGVIQRVYAIAASHLDYTKAVSSRLTSGGARFAAPGGCIGVEWTDLTTPTSITIAFPVTFAKTDLNKRTTFENEFDATLPGNGWKFDWDTTATTVNITVASYPENVRWELRTPDGWSKFYIGDQLDDGSAVTFDVQSESPHVLVAGETGSGKTEAMFVIAGQALQKGWEVAICDPKETGWAMWTRRRRPTNENGHDTGADKLRDGDARPGVIEHAVEVYGIRDVLVRCKAEMQRRKKVNGAHKVVKWTELPDEVKEAENIKPLMVVVDEALSLFDLKKGATDDIKAENEVRGEALSVLQTLIVEARALGIHVLLGIQRPDAAVLGGAMRSNLGARIACGVMEPTGYQMMFNVTGGVPRLVVNNPEGKKVMGRALVRSSPGQPIVPVQVAWLGPGQKDLNDLAPMPEEPEQEDETPTGPFNPYVQTGDPTPWLNQQFGEAATTPPWEQAPAGAPVWESADDATPAASNAAQAPPWEAAAKPEPPPWETAAKREPPPWETAAKPEPPPWEAAAASEPPPWETSGAPPTPPWEEAPSTPAPAATIAAPVNPYLEDAPAPVMDASWSALEGEDEDRGRSDDEFEEMLALMSSAPGASRDADEDEVPQRPHVTTSTPRTQAPAAAPRADAVDQFLGRPAAAPPGGRRRDAWLTATPSWQAPDSPAVVPSQPAASDAVASPAPVPSAPESAGDDWWD